MASPPVLNVYFIDACGQAIPRKLQKSFHQEKGLLPYLSTIDMDEVYQIKYPNNWSFLLISENSILEFCILFISKS